MSHPAEFPAFCWRLSVRRLFPRYLNGALSPASRARVERHIFSCASCRQRLDSLRLLHCSLLDLPAPVSRSDPDRVFRHAFAAAAPPAPSLRPPAGAIPRAMGLFSRPALLAAAAALLLVAQLGLFGLYRHRRVAARRTPQPVAGALDASRFQPVNIRDFKRNTAPDVVTEGYARDVHLDTQEGTLAFRLVDSSGATRFVVCEISDAIRLNPPPDGSRVRVYGVSRFDAQAGHSWYEINPVMKIAVLGK